MTVKRKYYVVWKGKETGVFDSWDACKRQIDGFAGAQYKSFKTKEAAESAFGKSFREFTVKPADKPFGSVGMLEEQAKFGNPIAESISVDAAFDGEVMEYKGVYTKTKQEIFKMGPFENATNNIGEFLAIVHALALLKKQERSEPFAFPENLPVYSDSVTAIHWVKTRKANTKLKRTPENESLFYLIQRAEKWLNENRYYNRLLKWETRAWGENPADYGRK
jgi:ribonuclease HI